MQPRLTTEALVTSTQLSSPAIICLSHLRWSFVFQRPQHLMSRYAGRHRVFFVEEPLYDESELPRMAVETHDGVVVIVPHLPSRYSAAEVRLTLGALLDQVIAGFDLSRYVLWYYTPAALPFSRHLQPVAVVYDCMDELAAFKGAAADLPALERALMARADLMFTGGHSLYDAKRPHHRNIHALPSSVDVHHFATARQPANEPPDQSCLPSPRLGFFGVLALNPPSRPIVDVASQPALTSGPASADWNLPKHI